MKVEFIGVLFITGVGKLQSENRIQVAWFYK